MGWLHMSEMKTREQIVAYLVRGEENEKRILEMLDHSRRGNVLWGVMQITDKSTGEVKRIITCDLLSKEKGFGWGYQSMDESMGPMYYTVPLKFFKMVPEPCNETAKKWREEVLAKRKAIKKRPNYLELYNQAKSEGKHLIVFLEHCAVPFLDVYFYEKKMCGTYNTNLFAVPKNNIVYHEEF